VEAGVVEVVFFVDVPDACPLGDGDGWVAGFWEDGAFEVAAHEGGLAIEEELVAFMGNAAEAEMGAEGVEKITFVVGEADFEAVGLGGKFAPEGGLECDFSGEFTMGRDGGICEDGGLRKGGDTAR